MADNRQSDQQPSKERRAPAASYPELVEDREKWKQLVGQQHADSEERMGRVLAAVTAQTDAQRGLTGQVAELVAALSASHAGTPAAAVAVADDDGGNGSGGETSPAVSQDEVEATDIQADPDGAANQEPEAPDLDDEPAASEETAGDTAGEAAVSDDNPAAGQEPEPATTAEPEEAASDKAAEADPQSPAPAADAHEGETEPAGDTASNANTLPSTTETTRAESARPEAGEAEEDPGTGGPASVARREDGDSDAPPGPSDAILADILGVLSAIRADQGAQSKLIQLIHRNPPPAAGGRDAAETAARSMRQHHELMGQIDRFIVALLNHLGMPVPEDAREMPDRPPPTDLAEIKVAASDLSKQLRAERSGFMRFAWIAAGAGGVALPAMLALGIFLQQEFALMPVPDPSFGWKDRIWERMGPEIADCLSLADAADGDCVITITPPAQ